MSDTLLTNLHNYISRHHRDIALSNFDLLSGGWECDIYTFRLQFPDGRSRDLILRLFLGNDGAEKTNRESAGLIQLHHVGYPVPEVFLTEPDDKILGRAFIIMEKFDGHGLWGVMSTAAPRQEDQLLEQFGQLVAHLHQIDWQPFTRHAARYRAEPMEVLNDWIETSRRLHREFEVEGFLSVTDWLDAHKKDITIQPAVVHLDFHANNVLLSEDNRMMVIDWSQITVADYRCDLAWTLMIMGDNGKPGWREKLLDTYLRTTGQPVLHLDYFNVLSYVKLLASTVITLKVGTEKLGMRPQNDDTRKEQMRYLPGLAQRLYDITGLRIPEIQTTLDRLT